jgi:hypothetical protein
LRRVSDRFGPILELEARNALEFAFIVGAEREPSGFGVSSNPEIDPGGLAATIAKTAESKTINR